tara:strand:+ start:1293 stop:2591 length:1299 start_codon:yes stop_codon:yes gene_type:complete
MVKKLDNTSKEMYKIGKTIFPINRSITGEGNRKTLKILSKVFSDIIIHEVKTGTKCFDWEIPKEWNVRDAYIINPDGKKICSFKKNNLHLLGYSSPINKRLPLNDLKKHLYSIPEKLNAIPYKTSYYKKNWGFCISENERKRLKKGTYTVFIDSELKNGSLTYGEILIKGKSKKEIFLSTYICHPSMANNEVSGPTVTIFLAKWLSKLKERKYSYRIVFIPETIGSITYLSKNLKSLKKNVIAGFNISCVGDNRSYSYLPSRNGKTLSDDIAKHVLKYKCKDFKSYTWLDRGSDERNYCSPGIDLPIASIMRTKYGEYPEYHTSDDKFGSVVTEAGLYGAYEIIKLAIKSIEINCKPKVKVLGEPKLDKRGLRSFTFSNKKWDGFEKLIIDFFSLCDGKSSLIEISETLEKPIWEVEEILNICIKNNIVKIS